MPKQISSPETQRDRLRAYECTTSHSVAAMHVWLCGVSFGCMYGCTCVCVWTGMPIALTGHLWHACHMVRHQHVTQAKGNQPMSVLRSRPILPKAPDPVWAQTGSQHAATCWIGGGGGSWLDAERSKVRQATQKRPHPIQAGHCEPATHVEQTPHSCSSHKPHRLTACGTGSQPM